MPIRAGTEFCRVSSAPLMVLSPAVRVKAATFVAFLTDGHGPMPMSMVLSMMFFNVNSNPESVFLREPFTYNFGEQERWNHSAS